MVFKNQRVAVAEPDAMKCGMNRNIRAMCKEWGTATKGLDAAENNGFNPDMAENPAPQAFMF